MTLIDQIAAAGVVGCGGAGFPTHLKLGGGAEHLIINGAECEPLLRTDRYAMRHHAPELVEAVRAMADALHGPQCTIALKNTYRPEIAALRAAIAEAGADIRLHLLESFYPAGDEQTVTYEVTGRVVPPGGIPLAVGAVVENAGTVLAIYDAIHGRPVTQKIVTVTGEAAHPTLVRVPIGTSFRRCLDLAGGPLHRQYALVSGGPMMGRLVHEPPEDAVVTKTTSGILVLPADGLHASREQVTLPQMLRRAASCCIQCSACTQLCPRYLLGHPLRPHRIMRKLSLGADLAGVLDDPDIRRAQLCCECGVCESVACPMGLQPRRVNAWIKRELGAAGIRCADGTAEPVPRADREDRKLPTRRAAARMGVSAYYDLELDEVRVCTPEKVEIPVKMHIGAAAEPVVRVGQRVSVGELIAACPEGARGAAVHASISGTVTAVGERIVIAGNGG